MTKTIQFFFILIISASVTGCLSVPYSNRTQFNMTPESTEEKAGIVAWNEILKSEKLSTNPKLINAINRVGHDIAQAANKPDYKWEFKVFESNEANAFCLPGGKIAVYSGLFQFTANDAELASVIGHEVGHAIARHGGERMTQEKVKNVGSTIISFVFDGTAGSLASTAFGIGADYGAILPFSRSHEHEADQIGLILMTKAGYHPYAALSFWQKFSANSSTSALGEFFSTHPISEKRIENMKTYLPDAMRSYNSARVKRGYGVIYRK